MQVKLVNRVTWTEHHEEEVVTEYEENATAFSVNDEEVLQGITHVLREKHGENIIIEDLDFVITEVIVQE